MAEPSIILAADPPGAALQAEAERLAAELSLPLANLDCATADLALVVTPDRLEIRVLRGEAGFAGGRAVAPEFAKLDVTSGPGRSLRQPLLRAAGIKKGDPYRPVVVDATAGLGEDSWLLAGAGCRVVAVERNPVLAALLRDAVERARDLAPEVAGRITVLAGDAAELLPKMHERADLPAIDVVYLDPMYPGHASRKTAERKPMRVLRWLVGEDSDADSLLEPALMAARRRVVVKRPTSAAALAGRTPVATHEGRGVRYDVYGRPGPANR